jgi:hypothetical protein
VPEPWLCTLSNRPFPPAHRQLSTKFIAFVVALPSAISSTPFTMASSSSSLPVDQGPTRPQSEHFESLIVTLKKRGHIVYSVELHRRMTGTTTMHATRQAYKDTKPSAPWYHSHPQLDDAFVSSVNLPPVHTWPIFRQPTTISLIPPPVVHDLPTAP